MEDQIKVIRNTDKPEPIFANGVTVNVNLFDARLEFFRDTPEVTTNEIMQKVVADIRLSPQLAKTLAEILMNQIRIYEETHGLIPTMKFPVHE